MNQYGTRRERIDDSFRARLDAEISPYFSPVDSVSANGASWNPNSFPQAMVYAPESSFANIYDDEEGLSRGTIFSDLYFPFECSSCRRNGGMM